MGTRASIPVGELPPEVRRKLTGRRVSETPREVVVGMAAQVLVTTSGSGRPIPAQRSALKLALRWLSA